MESPLALCTVTPAWRNSKHEITIATKKSYKDLPFAKVLGIDLLGPDLGFKHLRGAGWPRLCWPVESDIHI